jgi:hypothetical protein
MEDGPPASFNENYVHSRVQGAVEAHQLLLDNIVCFANVGLWRGTYSFSLNDHVCSSSLWVLVPHPSPSICRPYLAVAYSVVRTAVIRILGVSHDIQTLDKLNCVKRQLSLPAEFGGLNVPSLELDAERVHYASFTAILAYLITDYESESLDPMCGLIR